MERVLPDGTTPEKVCSVKISLRLFAKLSPTFLSLFHRPIDIVLVSNLSFICKLLFVSFSSIDDFFFFFFFAVSDDTTLDNNVVDRRVYFLY